MDGGGPRPLVFMKDVGATHWVLEQLHVAEVGGGHTGDEVSVKFDDDGE